MEVYVVFSEEAEVLLVQVIKYEVLVDHFWTVYLHALYIKRLPIQNVDFDVDFPTVRTELMSAF